VLTTQFELPIDVLRMRQNVKWGKYAADVLPAWVAEMDFAVAHPIQRVLERMVADHDYGYPDRGGNHGDGTLVEAFRARMRGCFGWETDPALVMPLSDLVQGTFSAILALSEPGDGVILQLPAYPPFHEAIKSTGRRLIAHRLHSGEAGWNNAWSILAGPALNGKVSISYHDNNYKDRIGWKEIVIGPKAHSTSDELRAYPKNLLQSPLEVTSVRTQLAPTSGRSAVKPALPDRKNPFQKKMRRK